MFVTFYLSMWNCDGDAGFPWSFPLSAFPQPLILMPPRLHSALYFPRKKKREGGKMEHLLRVAGRSPMCPPPPPPHPNDDNEDTDVEGDDAALAAK